MVNFKQYVSITDLENTLQYGKKQDPVYDKLANKHLHLGKAESNST